jgi:hypothetical protein
MPRQRGSTDASGPPAAEAALGPRGMHTGGRIGWNVGRTGYLGRSMAGAYGALAISHRHQHHR